MPLEGATQVTQLHGQKYEVSRTKRLWIASTAVAGVAPGTALSTTPPMAIHNLAAAATRVNVVILKVIVGYVSGTLGAGSIVYAQVSDAAAPAGGTQLTLVSGTLGTLHVTETTANQGSTVDATPTLIRPSGINFGAFLAGTAVLPAPQVDNVDGEIMVPPGETFVVEGVMAGGSTPLVMISVVWEEVLQ